MGQLRLTADRPEIDLLAEYEVTQMLQLVRAVGEKAGVAQCSTPELQELSRPGVVREIINEMRHRWRM